MVVGEITMQPLMIKQVPNSEATIEQMPFIEEGDAPFAENHDWFHCYSKISDEVYVGYSDFNDPEYIIVCHVPTGLRLKIRFRGGMDVEKGIPELLSEIPRELIEKGLRR